MSQSKTKETNIFKNIFARLWAVWALISFIATFLLFFLPSMLSYLFASYKKGQEYFISVSRWWMNVWLPLVGCPVRVYGKANFKEGENYIVTFNHNALLDVPLSAPYVPGANKTIAKASFAKVPLFGLFYKRGSVLVDRKSERSRIESYEKMKKVLSDGMHICIYPEGTRNRTDQPLKQFYEGAFKLAVETGKPIIPCILVGTKKAMPIHKSFYLFPTRLTMKFLPAVSPGTLSAKELKEKVYNIMLKEYEAMVK
ncbi:MAG: lysophospholipid acyltransferase family protein [Ferruginibacter sp.]